MYARIPLFAKRKLCSGGFGRTVVLSAWLVEMYIALPSLPGPVDRKVLDMAQYPRIRNLRMWLERQVLPHSANAASGRASLSQDASAGYAPLCFPPAQDKGRPLEQTPKEHVMENVRRDPAGLAKVWRKSYRPTLTPPQTRARATSAKASEPLEATADGVNGLAAGSAQLWVVFSCICEGPTPPPRRPAVVRIVPGLGSGLRWPHLA